MKYVYLLISAFVVTFFFSCKKSGDENTPPKSISIASVSPDKLSPGSTVTISGSNFGTDISKLKLKLAGKEVAITSVSDQTVTFTIPADLLTTPGTKEVFLELELVGISIAKRYITLIMPEPHGWYYPATISNPGSTASLCRLITFPTDSIGFIQWRQYLFRSTDGGITWKGVERNGNFGLGWAFSSLDGNNVWVESLWNVEVSTNGTSYKTGPSLGNSFIIGLYLSSPGYGLVATQKGQLRFIDGSFNTANIYKTYTSIHFSRAGFLWRDFSAVDGTNTMIAGTAYVKRKRKLTIVHEKAGAFSEYDLGLVTTSNYSKALQLIDKNTAVLIDGNNDILKLNGNKNWTKLNQKATAVHFTNANTGYAAYNEKIIKITDGGATWKDEFTLRAGETIYSICSKNGKIWAGGNDATQTIILKFNP